VFPLLSALRTRQGDAANLALRLWLAALALLVIFSASVLNAAVPLRVLDPRWLQGLIQVLLTQGSLPLIALVLLHLAVVLNPESTRMRRRRDRFSRLALIAALGFLLLLPLQIASTWGTLNLLASGQNQQRVQGLAMISSLRQAITAATSHQDLDSRLRTLSIPMAATSPADLALPFPQRQQKLLEGLQRSERELSDSGSPAPIPWPALLESTLRVAPTSLALAGAFAVFGYGTRRN
jgi:hypothetical protein